MADKMHEQHTTTNLDLISNVPDTHDERRDLIPAIAEDCAEGNLPRQRYQESIDATPVQGGQEQSSQHPIEDVDHNIKLSSDGQPLPTTKDNNNTSKHSHDDGEPPLTTSLPASPRSAVQAKKKRYATQHSDEWLEETTRSADHPLSAKSHSAQPTTRATTRTPRNQTPSSAGASANSALSFFRGAKHSQHSPGQDAPAIHPGLASTYLVTASSSSAYGHQNLVTQSETADENALSAIDEEQTVAEPQRGPPEQAPARLTARQRLSRLLRRSR